MNKWQVACKSLILAALLIVCRTIPAEAADVFERHTIRELQKVLDQGPPTAQVTLNDVAKIKPLAPTLSSPCFAVKTDEGNIAKVLVGWGLRKSGDQPTPVVLLERFVTYRVDRPDLTTAAGKDVMLFPGFGFNLDIGQVVPAGQGADLEFTTDGTLKPSGTALLVALQGSQLAAVTPQAKPDPNDHEGVLPTDFVGNWQFDADSRWKGELQLKVDPEERVTGTFVSDELQNRYEVVGQFAAVPHNLRLDVSLANTQMQVDAFLWTKDKSKMAGTVTLTGRKFGFVATRIKD